jgi:hypothetical protein
MTNKKGKGNDGDSDPFGFAQGRLLRVRMTGETNTPPMRKERA